MPETVTVHDIEDQRRLFRKSVPMQVMLEETLRGLGKTEGDTCLDIGASNGMLSHYLRKHGGTWHTAVESERVAEFIRPAVTDNICVIQGTSLPYKKQMFDYVVVFHYLERVQSDESLIEECHRVLKPDGRLVINVSHAKKWTVLSPLRSLLGLSRVDKGWVRPGYSESELFNILKHGFDVQSMKTYSRFFVELTNAFVERLTHRMKSEPHVDAKRMLRTYAIASLFFNLAYQLDMLLFLTRGHSLIAVAKRRAWRPRNAPQLVDGRSISEAVLSPAQD